MRTKFRENHGSFSKIDPLRGTLTAIWGKNGVSIATSWHYNGLFFQNDEGITVAVLKGQEAKKALKILRRIYNEDARKKRKPRRKRGQTQGRGVLINADQIHLSVGAVNEPSEFSTKG